MQDMENNEQFSKNVVTELSNVKAKLNNIQISEEGFCNNDAKTQFYTGVPNFLLLMHLFNFIHPHIKSSSRNALTQFQELLLTLRRIKLNLPLQDIAYQFNISVSTASRIFDRWIDVLCTRLKFLIHWPDREELQRTMPSIFQQNFRNKVAVIIDCFEVFLDRPSSLVARAMTWSSYKHHNTVKFLIGITPRFGIIYIQSLGRKGE